MQSLSSPNPGRSEVASSAQGRQLSNHQLPVLRLLPELLYQIFDFYRRAERSSDTDSPRLQWVSASQVCRQWRSAALAHSALWSDIPAYLSDSWFTAFIQRSGSAPLRISFDCDERSGAAKDLLLSHLYRTEQLNIHGRRIAVLTLLDTLTNTPAPLLQVFSVDANEPGTENQAAITFPRVLFSNHHPELHRIKIGVLFPQLASSSIVSSAALRRITVFGDMRVSDILNVMSSASNLEVFELSGSFAKGFGRADDISMQPTSPIVLPKLYTLALQTMSIKAVLSIFDRQLEVPSLRNLSVGVQVGARWHQRFSDLCRLLSKYVRLVERTSPSLCSISSSDHALLDLTSFKLMIKPVYSTPVAIEDFTYIVHAAHQHFDLFAIRTLRLLDIWPDPSNIEWRELLRLFHHVTDVILLLDKISPNLVLAIFPGKDSDVSLLPAASSAVADLEPTALFPFLSRIRILHQSTSSISQSHLDTLSQFADICHSNVRSRLKVGIEATSNGPSPFPVDGIMEAVYGKAILEDVDEDSVWMTFLPEADRLELRTGTSPQHLQHSIGRLRLSER